MILPPSVLSRLIYLSSYLRRYIPETAMHPVIERGEDALRLEQHHSDTVVKYYVLREYGITIAGDPVKPMIDPISPDMLRQAQIELLDFWWLPMLEAPEKLQHDGYRCYAILSMCRILYTLITGDVTSKPGGAAWAQNTLPEHLHPVIAQAAIWQPGTAFNNLPATLALMRYTGDISQQYR